MKRRPLELKVASPCDENWDDMSGDDAIRHCDKCDKNVYHLSYMSTEQVERLLDRAGDPPCVRFFQRADGTVLLGDCPVGSGKKRRRRAFVGAGVGAAMLSAVGFAVAPSAGNTPEQTPKDEPCEVVMGGATAEPVPPPPPKHKPATAVKRPPRPVMGRLRVRPHKPVKPTK